jgi:sporulation protein YlmC with PRC-barrel domain
VSDKNSLFKGQKIVPFTKVTAIGDDAVTIEKSSSAERVANFPQIVKFVKDGLNLAGTIVVEASGTEVGHVSDFFLQEETGKIISLELTGKRIERLFKGRVTIPAEEIRTVGRDAIIVRQGASDRLVKMDGSWQEALTSLKSTARSFWRSPRRRANETPKDADPTKTTPPEQTATEPGEAENMANDNVKPEPELQAEASPGPDLPTVTGSDPEAAATDSEQDNT